MAAREYTSESPSSQSFLKSNCKVAFLLLEIYSQTIRELYVSWRSQTSAHIDALLKAAFRTPGVLPATLSLTDYGRFARDPSANCCEALTCLDSGGFRGLGCEPASGPNGPTQVG